ncbi:hypothetical protein [Corynebacterium gerontici]|uniref:Uncharacterized protein n=1 Tax=Corynebacterium gerontici TaxID=2079234 RepID=A0A3G6IZB3_9CORY|nr:hypothetical protein [Corynebacterium gerontici]AZA11131.1 hypothetical protein CGERO_04070 [Corynebacterium gerontici]
MEAPTTSAQTASAWQRVCFWLTMGSPILIPGSVVLGRIASGLVGWIFMAYVFVAILHILPLLALAALAVLFPAQRDPKALSKRASAAFIGMWGSTLLLTFGMGDYGDTQDSAVYGLFPDNQLGQLMPYCCFGLMIACFALQIWFTLCDRAPKTDAPPHPINSWDQLSQQPENAEHLSGEK